MDYYRVALKLIDLFQVKTVIDIGANQGTFGLSIAKSRNVDVYLVEPVRENVRNILRNIYINRVQRCRVIPVAVADKRGKALMYIRTLSDAKLLLSSKNNFNRLDNLSDVQITRVVSLEDLLKIVGESAGNILIKIDCQGSELSILSSAPQSIKDKVRVIIVEVHESLYGIQVTSIVKIMEKLGFNLLFKIDYPFPRQPHLYFVG
ncbi:MAG: FkbM family methyltransferase [Nitrososphaerota archaeon]